MSRNHDPLGARQRLGKYEVQAEIGRGGMGVVYGGYDPLLERPVAIKVLAPHLVWEPGFVERFLREARTAARLKHAGIVAIYDVGQEGNAYYIVMEYLEGRTLSNLVRSQGPMSGEQVLSILRPLAAALDFAHQQGLVHRDVKPSNIVVHPRGNVTLTDFGVARAAQETRLTTTGALVGTPQYMSPEQARGDNVDLRTDVYSLGVVAYEMLVGRVPFEATTPHAVLHQVIYDPTPPVCSQRPDLQPEVDSVLSKALSKEPDRRYDTAREFVQALEAALVVRPKPAASPAEPAPQVVARSSARPGPPPARKQERSRDRAPSPSPPLPSAGAGDRPAGGLGLGLAWFLASAAGWAIGWALGVPVGEVMGMAIDPVVDFVVREIAIGAASWAVLGLVVGAAQWLLLRRRFPRAWEWMVATLASFGVVGSIKWGQGLFVEQAMDGILGWLDTTGWEEAGLLIGILFALLIEGLTGLLIGLAQWLALQNRVEKPARWVLVSVGAWAGAGLLISALMAALGPLEEEIAMWAMPLLTGFVVAAISAAGAVWVIAERKDGQ